jgi:signal transduction histidine kinase
LFQPFYIIESSRSLNPNGIGLGLNICKQVVEKSGGKIWIDKSQHITESEEEHGTTFIFTFKAEWDFKNNPGSLIQ